MKRRANLEGTVTQRRDGRWEARLSLPGGRRRSYYAKTKQEAVGKLQKGQAAVLTGQVVAGDRLKVGDFLESWLRDVASQRVRPRTFTSYQELVRLHITPAIGYLPLAKLTPKNVEGMMAGLRQDRVGARTVQHCRQALRAALNVAMRWDLVTRNAAALSSPPPVPQHEVRPLSLGNAGVILQTVKGDRLEALYLTALTLGLRQSESLGLQWSDVDLEVGVIRVQRGLQRYSGDYHLQEPKTARARRTIPSLPPAVISALREHRARQLAERLRAGPAWQGDQWSTLVFTNELGGPLSGSWVTHHFQALLRLVGLPPMRYHDLRHERPR